LLSFMNPVLSVVRGSIVQLAWLSLVAPVSVARGSGSTSSICSCRLGLRQWLQYLQYPLSLMASVLSPVAVVYGSSTSVSVVSSCGSNICCCRLWLCMALVSVVHSSSICCRTCRQYLSLRYLSFVCRSWLQ